MAAQLSTGVVGVVEPVLEPVEVPDEPWIVHVSPLQPVAHWQFVVVKKGLEPAHVRHRRLEIGNNLQGNPNLKHIQ